MIKPFPYPLSQGDQSPDDGGSRLLTANCHPDCPNSGSNCSACSGKEFLLNLVSENSENHMVLRTFWSKTNCFLRLVRPFSCKEASRCVIIKSIFLLSLYFWFIFKEMTNNQVYQIFQVYIQQQDWLHFSTSHFSTATFNVQISRTINGKSKKLQRQE